MTYTDKVRKPTIVLFSNTNNPVNNSNHITQHIECINARSHVHRQPKNLHLLFAVKYKRSANKNTSQLFFYTYCCFGRTLSAFCSMQI